MASYAADWSREPYPFDHAQGLMTLGRYAVASLPAADDLGAGAGGGGQMLDSTASLEVRIFSRLAVMAEQVEAALGLPTLPELADKS